MLRFKIREKILALAMFAAILPILAVAVLLQVQRGSLDETVNEELGVLIREHAAAIAGNVYRMCEMTNYIIRSGEDSLTQISNLHRSIADIVVGKTGHAFVLGGKGKDRGNYIISHLGGQDGENVWNARDARGFSFVKTLVNRAIELPAGEVVFERFAWKDAGEQTARLKTVAIMYFEPWDWVIGIAACEDDYHTVTEHIHSVLSGLSGTTLLIAVLVLALVILVSYGFASAIGGSADLIATCSRRLAMGDSELTGMDLNKIEKMRRREDELGDVGRAFDELTSYLKDKTRVSDQIARGDLEAPISAASEADGLGRAMISMKESLRAMQVDLKNTIDAQTAGNIDARCHPDQLAGTYAELLRGINDVLDTVTSPIRESSDILQEYAGGNLKREMHFLPGKLVVITEAINAIRQNLLALIDDMNRLVEAAIDGELAVRAEAGRHLGDFRRIVDGVNATMNAIIEPINEASQILAEMSRGDLSVRMTGNYRGDYDRIKASLHASLEALNEILEQVRISADQVNSGAQQVSDSSQSLSQGATEQASSLEEISSSLTELAAQTRQNAEHATQANQLANQAREAAQNGNGQMGEMLHAMKEIDESSSQISRIIKVIEEIAFQTNLLALNAAVEAARAGVHGRGFAVVAEEVRNLSQRSSKAAKETTDLIERSVGRVHNGAQIANQTAKALDGIVLSVTRVSDLVDEIAAASREQAVGIEQVSQGLGQIDSVTQNNAANAEESASASEELSSQAMQLKQMLTRFRLSSGDGRKPPAANTGKPIRQGGFAGWDRPFVDERLPNLRHAEEIKPNDIINLDDEDYGKF